MSEPGAGSTGSGGWAAPLESAGIPVAELQTKVTALVAGRPEVAVAGAFAGGLLVAMIVRRLGR
ncbi:MAG: hypothetical protein ACR2KV_11340 [Solirubrobacteraceae bacterium]